MTHIIKTRAKLCSNLFKRLFSSMDDNRFTRASLFIIYLFIYVKAESHDQTYDLEMNTQMIPNDADSMVEIPCISKVEGVGICLLTNGCHGINHFQDGRCQMMTDLIAATLDDATSSTAILCELDP